MPKQYENFMRVTIRRNYNFEKKKIVVIKLNQG